MFKNEIRITRRQALLATAAISIVRAADEPETEVTIVEFNDAGQKTGVVKVKKVVHTEAEWRKLLTLQQLYVARKGNSDLHFYGTYFKLHDPGIYRCICCGTAAFSSENKFDSPSGFACFTQPIAEENIRTRVDVDTGPRRLDIMCKRCDAHLGFLYDDGPEPTNNRYCVNESSLKFVPKNR
jgi:peptide-methionine (R)-S-oxide reductase